MEDGPTERAPKSLRGPAAASSPPEGLEEMLRGVVGETFDNKLMGVTKRVEDLEQGQAKLEQRQSRVEEDLQAMRLELRQPRSSAASTAPSTGQGSLEGFIPRYLEVKGFCEWDRRTTDGADRKEARRWVDVFKNKVRELDADLAANLGEPECRGIRCNAFKVWFVNPRLGRGTTSVARELVLRDEGPLMGQWPEAAGGGGEEPGGRAALQDHGSRPGGHAPPSCRLGGGGNGERLLDGGHHLHDGARRHQARRGHGGAQSCGRLCPYHAGPPEDHGGAHEGVGAPRIGTALLHLLGRLGIADFQHATM
mmetsp:Transcript_71982/g.204255  ORF Transcript_71982/g.204255 Transcript_71982/m.204255 type:complete len:309 (+) Transcript_71982:256-1182(+)